MDAPTIAAFASVAVALVAVLGLVGPVYLRLGHLEGEVKAGRERSDTQFRESRERSDSQYRELREWSDSQYRELRDWAEAQFRESRERSDPQFREARERADAQHAETLAEIRRLTEAFLSHSHAPDGGVIFRIPPPGGLTTPE